MALPSAAAPSVQERASFDLTRELPARTAWGKRAQRYFMMAGWGFLILGVVLAVLSIWLPGRQDITLFAGIMCFVFGPFTMFIAFTIRRQDRTSAASRLDVDHIGIRLSRMDGTVLSVRWNDPSLQIDVCQFTDPDHGFLPAEDPRRVMPQWIYVYTPPNFMGTIWSTVPEGAFEVLVQGARGHSVLEKVFHVGYYWFAGPKSSGQLRWEYEGKLSRAPALNGRLVQIRGSMWRDSPTGYASSYWEAKRLMARAGLSSAQWTNSSS